MSVYAERPSRLPGAVLWTAAPSGREPRAVLPDGCMDLMWSEGRLLVAGPDTGAHVPDGPPASWAGLRFFPGTAPGFLGVPAHALRDRRVDLTDLWPPARVRRLRAAVEAATDPATGLEEAVLPGVTPPDPALRRLVTALGAGRPVGAVADELGFGARRLHRTSLARFGYGPKTLARVLRLQRALALARAGAPLAGTAVRAGYADQAHLARDVRALTGRTPSELLGERREQVDAVAVRVVDDGVPLAPEGVPGLELPVVASADELFVDGVHLTGRLAAQGE
ncbi:AraC family transcriptional regulator [Streptomyces galbus]|nr:AraC family transcriptional regulator [Streptomyces galbus]